jgi:hypothetical protein
MDINNCSEAKLICSLQRYEKKVIVLNSFLSGNKVCFDEKFWILIKEFLIGDKHTYIYDNLFNYYDELNFLNLNNKYNLSKNFNKKCKFKKISHEDLKNSINKIKSKIIMHSKWNMNKKIELPDDVWKIIKIFAGYQDVLNFEVMDKADGTAYQYFQYSAIDKAYYFKTILKNKTNEHKFFILEKEQKLIIKYIFLNKLSNNQKKKILIYYFIKLYITLFGEYSSIKPLFIDFDCLF